MGETYEITHWEFEEELVKVTIVIQASESGFTVELHLLTLEYVEKE